VKLPALLLLLVLALPTLPDTVRVTATGARYHRAACAALTRGPSYLVRRTAADSAGYTPCRRCWTLTTRKPTRFQRIAR